ncbi:hypothetical protein K474DRAFT_1772732 [Panus rudis PR-1116 ss-1]|nr:hypothetical protein K474DRAFT_1772732 [Panus rudis PR-1116 ss-1]
MHAAPASTPKSVSRRPSRTKTLAADPADSLLPSEIPGPGRLAAAFRTPSEPYYSLDTSLDGSGSKRRKLERACDFCRRRKTKCDGPKMHGSRCTNCIQNGRECTYVEVSKPRGPPKAYVQQLEDRVEKIEALLRRLRPEVDFSKELGPPIPRDSWKTDSPVAQPSLLRQASQSFHHSPKSSLVPPTPSLSVPGGAGVAAPYPGSGPVTITLTHMPSRETIQSLRRPSTSDEDEVSSASSSDTEDYGELSLIRNMENLSIKPLEHDNEKEPDGQWRFHGKSSSFKLINAARKLQQGASSADGNEGATPPPLGANRRPYFWQTPPYETILPKPKSEVLALIKAQFPPDDLAKSLADAYFEVMNAHFPVVHRPTFDRQLRVRLHERDVWFGCLCMTVFGMGSRWSKDPRVLTLPEDYPEGKVPESTSPLWGSAGWKYVHVAVEIQRTSYGVLLAPCLFEVQSYHLIALFLRSSSFYSDAWTFVNLGIRKAQDVGAHRRRVYGRTRTVEDELWKRTYWALISFDHIGSMILGRPCGSRDEDCDLEFPLEVDDEYWEHENPNLMFRQPAGKLCQVMFFTSWLKLTQIAAFALRTLYALGSAKVPLGLIGARWQEETLGRLNHALGVWVEEVPEHLRWNPDMEHPLFANQATVLVTTYYMVQILVHRPFIPVPSAVNSFAGFHTTRRHSLVDRPDFPWTCLSICTNAAKASAEIMETNAKKQRVTNMTSTANACYICAGVLLVHVWILRSMEKAEGPRTSPERKQMFAERMVDLMDSLQKLMDRLEEIAPSMEIARDWLEQIRESLPPPASQETPSPDMLPTQVQHPISNDRYYGTDDRSYPSSLTPENPSIHYSPDFTGYEFHRASPPEHYDSYQGYSVLNTSYHTQSINPTTPLPPYESGSSLANALYPFNPAQSWEPPRTEVSQARTQAPLPQQLNQSYSSQSRGSVGSLGSSNEGSPLVVPSQLDQVRRMSGPVPGPLRHQHANRRVSMDSRSYEDMRAAYTSTSTLLIEQPGRNVLYERIPTPPIVFYQQAHHAVTRSTTDSTVLIKREPSSGSLAEAYQQYQSIHAGNASSVGSVRQSPPQMCTGTTGMGGYTQSQPPQREVAESQAGANRGYQTDNAWRDYNVSASRAAKRPRDAEFDLLSSSSRASSAMPQSEPTFLREEGTLHALIGRDLGGLIPEYYRAPPPAPR